MPLDSSPRSLPFSIFLPPGRVEWCRATGTRSPAWMFQAPVTIWTGSAWPTSSWHTHMWSLLGWRTMDKILPTTTLEISSPRSWVSSTLEPDRVMASAKSLSEASTWTNSSSHFLLRFIVKTPCSKDRSEEIGDRRYSAQGRPLRFQSLTDRQDFERWQTGTGQRPTFEGPAQPDTTTPISYLITSI